MYGCLANNCFLSWLVRSCPIVLSELNVLENQNLAEWAQNRKYVRTRKNNSCLSSSHPTRTIFRGVYQGGSYFYEDLFAVQDQDR